MKPKLMIDWVRDIVAASRIALTTSSYMSLLVICWAGVLTLFLLLSRSSVIVHVLTSNQYDGPGKLGFLASVYLNFFIYIASPVVFTAVIFTLLAGLNITLLIYLTRIMQRQASNKGTVGAAGALLASHVLSCGSSLLAPFFSALAGSGAYNDPGRLQVAGIFGLVLNVVGLILILRSTASVARHINGLPPVTASRLSDYLGVNLPTGSDLPI